MYPRSIILWGLAASTFAMSVAVFLVWAEHSGLTGRVFAPTGHQDIPWRTFEIPEVESGATIPADTHVLIHIPHAQTRITREVLLGHRGKTVRYWGYCFEEGEEPPYGPKAVGLPGKLFLSEAERAHRDSERIRNLPFFSVFHPPSRRDLDRMRTVRKGKIRHQLEVFLGGTSCYVMTEKPLALGTDRDGDFLNAAEETIHKTSIKVQDTDGDGVGDGAEVLTLNTDPIRRDSDSDGIIDGIEDINRNGTWDPGETNPRDIDTDDDGLCDGFCRIAKTGRTCGEFGHTTMCVTKLIPKWRGEDKNLNGTVDGNETDPRTRDTDRDGILDEQEYFQCLIEQKEEC